MNKPTKVSSHEDINQLLHDAINKVAVGPNRGKDLSAEVARRILSLSLEGAVDETQLAILLIALRMKGEADTELFGLLDALQTKTERIDIDVPELIQIADPFDGYNRHLPITPFLPALLAACGVNVVLLGAKSLGPKHGVNPSKVYNELGINSTASLGRVADQIQTYGWGYLDQSVYAPSLASLDKFRDKIVKRTALTTLERIVSPFAAQNNDYLYLGYVHRAYREIYSKLAKHAGFSASCLVKGVEGGISPALNKQVRLYCSDHLEPATGSQKIAFELSPELSEDEAAHRFMLANSSLQVAVSSCSQLGVEALAGKPSLMRNSLVVSAACVLLSFKKEKSFEQAVEKVQYCLDNGSALERFTAVKSHSNNS